MVGVVTVTIIASKQDKRLSPEPSPSAYLFTAGKKSFSAEVILPERPLPVGPAELYT